MYLTVVYKQTLLFLQVLSALHTHSLTSWDFFKLDKENLGNTPDLHYAGEELLSSKEYYCGLLPSSEDWCPR